MFQVVHRSISERSVLDSTFNRTTDNRRRLSSVESMSIEPPALESTVSHRKAHMELINYNNNRLRRRSIVDMRGVEATPALSNIIVATATTTSPSIPVACYGSIELDEEMLALLDEKDEEPKCAHNKCCLDAAAQLPAIMVVSLLILMTALPIGVAYFPIGWSSEPLPDDIDDATADGIRGPFPLPGKEALGIRMALFATIIGQLVMTFASRFTNPVSFQLLENVPFYHVSVLMNRFPDRSWNRAPHCFWRLPRFRHWRLL